MNWGNRCRALRALLFVLSAGLAGIGSAAGDVAHQVHYSVTGEIAGPDGSWDYVSIEPEAHRLYMSHNGAATLDLATRRWLPTLDPGAMVSAVLPLPAVNRLVFSERSSHSLVIAQLSSHRILARIDTGIGTDGMAFDPKAQVAVVMAGEGRGFAALVDVAHLKPVARVAVGGDLEFPASNGLGTVYINVSSRGGVAVLDLATHAIVGRYPIKACRNSTGLAYDAPSSLLISACDGMVAVLRAHGRDLHLVKEFRTGQGADAVFIDGIRRLAFVPCGGSGTLTIVDIRDPAHPRIAQVVKTQKELVPEP